MAGMMDKIQQEMVEAYVKHQMQNFMGGGKSKQESESSVMDMVKERFGLGDDDAHGIVKKKSSEFPDDGSAGLFDQAKLLAKQALGSGEEGSTVENLIKSQFGLDHTDAKNIVQEQQSKPKYPAENSGGFMEQAGQFLGKYTAGQ